MFLETRCGAFFDLVRSLRSASRRSVSMRLRLVDSLRPNRLSIRLTSGSIG